VLLACVGPRASTTPLPGGTTNTTESNTAGYQQTAHYSLLCCAPIYFAPEPFADNSAVRTAVSRRRFRVTGLACSDGTRINSSLVSSGEDQTSSGARPAGAAPPPGDRRRRWGRSCSSWAHGRTNPEGWLRVCATAAVERSQSWARSVDVCRDQGCRLPEASRIGCIRTGFIGFGWDLHPKRFEGAV
jgi:hypothetical protein